MNHRHDGEARCANACVTEREARKANGFYVPPIPIADREPEWDSKGGPIFRRRPRNPA